MEEKKPQLKYATTKNQLIQAIIGEHFRFTSEVQARKKIESLAADFILSKKRPEGLADAAAFLWVKDFQVSKKDISEGYKGNFISVNFKPAKGVDGGKKFTLYATKHDVELKQHPMQMRKKTSHPNWGHPILRLIKKGKKYKTLEEAQNDLQLLHEEYPTTSIPLGAKITIMVYSKTYGDEKPIRKHMLEIKTHKEGGFVIEIAENEGNKKPASETAKKDEPAKEGEGGYFTSMVELRRAKKKKPVAKEQPRKPQ